MSDRMIAPSSLKNWDDETVADCIRQATHQIPGVVRSIAAHDAGRSVLSDAEFQPLATELFHFLRELKLANNLFELADLLGSVRLRRRDDPLSRS